jgi:hypothetical protein
MILHFALRSMPKVISRDSQTAEALFVQQQENVTVEFYAPLTQNREWIETAEKWAIFLNESGCTGTYLLTGLEFADRPCQQVQSSDNRICIEMGRDKDDILYLEVTCNGSLIRYECHPLEVITKEKAIKILKAFM